MQIEAEKGKFSVTMMCRLLAVSRSGYYAQKERRPSRRQQDNEKLSGLIKHHHQESRGSYGSPRIHKDLKELGFDVGRHRIARLMREQGITGELPKRFKRTTDSKHCFPVANNILDRKFEADAPDKAWVADITYVRTWEGWLYLAAIIDLFSRKVVGWSMATHLGKELALEALDMAL
jgi:transposase InsO family protein